MRHCRARSFVRCGVKGKKSKNTKNRVTRNWLGIHHPPPTYGNCFIPPLYTERKRYIYIYIYICMVNRIGERERERKKKIKVVPSGQLFSHESQSKIFPLFCFVLFFFLSLSLHGWAGWTVHAIDSFLHPEKGRTGWWLWRGGGHQHKQEGDEENENWGGWPHVSFSFVDGAFRRPGVTQLFAKNLKFIPGWRNDDQALLREISRKLIRHILHATNFESMFTDLSLGGATI